ncbi:MAG: hypothetical protein HZB92_05610 [Euryarchaeota archaeon]|nr:hypothetical protein [Euryarchaeota archaeon]
MIEINIKPFKYIVTSLSKKLKSITLLPKNVIWSDTVEEDMDGPRAATNHGEFPTVIIGPRDAIKKKYTSGTISGVRVRTDRIEHVGTEVGLNKGVEDLSREWNEIVINQ